MSEEKGAIGRRDNVKVCGVCGHTVPWHSMICPRVGGGYCLECETILPRHYPWCSIGKRYQFLFWATPRDMQKELETHFNEHMRNRIVAPPTAPEKVETPTGPEKFVMPEEGRRRIKEMLASLANHTRLASGKDRDDKPQGGNT